MEIQSPADMSNIALRHERITVIREMARLVVYLGALNQETVNRTPITNYEAQVLNIDRS